MTHLIFGALGEPGRAIATALARRGERLCIADRPGAELEELASSLRANGADVTVTPWTKQADLDAILTGSAAKLTSVICAHPGGELAAILPFGAQAWTDFEEYTRTPWQIAKACARAGFAGAFVVTGSAAAISGPAMSGLAFLARTMSRAGGLTAHVAIGDDPVGLAAMVETLVRLAPGSTARLEAAEERAGAPSAAATVEARHSTLASSPANPRRVVITGGAGAIAQALCRTLVASLAQPLRVLLVDRDPGALSHAVAELEAEGIDVQGVEGDIADPSLPGRAIAAALSAFGGIDAVFSHAGIGLGDPTLSISDHDFDASFAINLRAAWLLADASDAALRESRGSFIATATIGALRPGLAPPVYSASKAALVSLVEQLAVVWGPHGVRANAVSPGPTLTPMNRLWNASPSERHRAVGGYPLRRIAEPAEVAAAMAFLASPAASYISGHNVVVDGALSRLQA